jgi:phosphoglycolate phosphatase-like HAD superfamily hydrolase
MRERTASVLIAFDFDGVLCNGLCEVYAVSLATYAGLCAASTLPESAGDPDRIAQTPLFRDFERLVPLGNRAEDFGVALAALDHHIRIDDQEAYDRFFEAQDHTWLETFHRLFYEQREQLRCHDPSAWYSLHRPYPGIIELLRSLRSTTTLAVATAKDRRSVELLLARFGASDIFDDELILDKEAGVDKVNHLQALSQRTAVRCSDMTFIDDKVNHLRKVAPLGVRPVLAAWGYNSPREHAIARSLGFAIATLATARDVLLEGQ